MRRSSRLFNRSTDEIGWISTTDMFVVACCFLLFLTVGSKRRAKEAEIELGVVTNQLELSSVAAAPNAAQKLAAMTNERDELINKLAAMTDERDELINKLAAMTDERDELINKLAAMTNEREELITRLENANKSIERIANQRAKEKASELTEKQILDAKVRNLEDGLRQSESKATNLQVQLTVARQATADARTEAISRQRANNNKLVGLGGKLENVVFMVDISKSMQSGPGPNGMVLNNWLPIVEVIERWINALNVGSAALIVFGDTADVKVEMQRLSEGGRERILEVLQQIDPIADGTNFLAAFEEAYRIRGVDTIIVFSDGLPSVDINGNRILVSNRLSGESEEAYRARIATSVSDNINRVLAVHRKILEMAKQHPNVAINVIGLGSGLYNEKTGNLLNELALNNGGVFLALPSRVLSEDAE